MAVVGETALTIGDLSECTGLSVRNIRAYQARGLLQPPVRRGRTGYYGPEHVARLELICALREDGFNLAAIGTLVARGPEFITRVQQLRADLEPASSSGHEWVPMDAESVRLTQEYSPSAIDRFIQQGTIRRDADGTLVNPTGLAQTAWILNRHGATPGAIIELLFEVERHARRMATTYVEFLSASDWGIPRNGELDVAHIRDTYAQLQPAAIRMMSILFEIALAKAAWQSIEEHLGTADPAPAPA